MERNGHAFGRVFQRQFFAFGVFFRDFIRMIKNSRRQPVRRVVFHCSGNDDGRFDSDGLDRLVLSGIGTRGNLKR